MLKQKTKFILLSLSLILVLAPVVFPAIAHAAGLVPCGGTGEKPCNVQDIFYLIARVTNWLVGLAGIYAVFQIVNAGFWLITTMGNEESVTKWRKGLTNAVVGFVLVMLAYLFMNTAVNLLLAQGQKGKTVNFRDPLCYISNGDRCVVPQNK